MDTAQRGMGLDWAADPGADQAVRRREAASVGGLLACGAGTDQLDLDTLPAGRAGLDAVLGAYREQIEVVDGRRRAGHPDGLAGAGRGSPPRPADYLDGVRRPCWTEVDQPGHPALAGRRCSTRRWPATGAATTWPRRRRRSSSWSPTHAAKVDGVKVSLLDADHEIALRARLAALPQRVRLYTGDDFNYPELDRRRRRRTTPTRCSASSPPSPRPPPPRCRPTTPATPARARALLDSTQELGPARLRRAHLLLQDRGRLPGLAERAPARLRAWSAAWQSARSVPHLVQAVPARRRRRAAARPRAGRAADDDATWRCTGSAADVGGSTTGSR